MFKWYYPNKKCIELQTDVVKAINFLNLQYTEYYVNNGLKTALVFSSKEKDNFINDKDKLMKLLEYGDRDD